MSVISRLLSLFVVLLVAAIVRAKVPGQVENIFGQCIVPLGMEAGKIPDDAITASSSYEMKSVGPQNARIRQEKNGGAWCPKAQISSAIKEYLEIDLTKNHLITWTETQGRFGNGQGQEYAEAFFLEYWRDEKWHQYKNLDGDRVLRGNSNTYLVEKQKLDLPFVASRVRFVPYSLHPRTVCMRVEIYGCLWAQYILRYIAPKGSANFEDTSYDGVEIEGVLEGGLGQLTDGILGDISELSNPSTGSNWVGWSDREDVQLIFEFQDFQLFQNCSIHVANLPERQIEIFSVLRVWFSLDGIVYQPEPETLESPSDSRRNAITISIALQSRVARFIKLELVQSSKRLVISEVIFQTVSGIESLSEEDSIDKRVESSIENSVGVSTEGSEGSEWPERAVRAYGNESELRLESELPEGTLKIPNGTIYSRGTNGANSDRSDVSSANAIPVGTSQSYIGLVSGVLTVVILTLSCTTFLMKQRGRNKVALLQKHTALLCGHSTTDSGNTINLKDGKLRNSVLLNGLTHSRLSLKSKPAQSDRSPTPRASAPAILTLETNSDRSSGIYDSTYKPFSENNVATAPRVCANEAEYSEFKSTLNFPKKNIMGALTSTSFLPKERSQTQTIKPNPKIHESHYAATDILTIKRREQPSTSGGSLFTSMQIRDEALLSRNLKSYEIQRISRYRLRILNKLGEGSFGLVHICEAKAIQSVETGTLKNRQLVLVKSLWRGVVDSLRKDFTRDMCVLAAIRNPNIARIIALVEEEPLGAVFEYGQYGDLPTFLHEHESKIDSNLSPTSSRFRRLNFLTQIASGMKYLESLNIPHCDLAARNCMVTQDLIIKVSDHAVYCAKYDHHYYVDGSYVKIPLRWMAWEAVLLNQRTCRGDVWSYAVTTWEILKNCKEVPFSELTSEQVLENCGRWYHGNGQSDRNQPRLLVRPACCPEKLYQIMVDCWSQQSEDRPTFEEIYRYLDMLDFD